MTNSHAFPIGAKVKVAERHRDTANGRDYPDFGVTYTVESCRTTGAGFMVRVENLSYELGTDWFVLAETPVAEPVKFSLTKETSREYAALQVGKKLKDESNSVLQSAADGLEVDAFDFRNALIDAMSAATTRSERSPQRREYAKQIRHLFYIVNGVLDNAALNRAPVDAGTKSPALDAARTQVATLEAALAKVNGDLDRTTSESEKRKATMLEIREQVLELQGEVKALFADANAHVVSLEATLVYAIGLLSAQSQAQVVGFADAHDVDIRPLYEEKYAEQQAEVDAPEPSQESLSPWRDRDGSDWFYSTEHQAWGCGTPDNASFGAYKTLDQVKQVWA